MYGTKTTGALAFTGTALSVGWTVAAAVTMLFVGVALFQLGRRGRKVRP
jgi:amino acid transporter